MNKRIRQLADEAAKWAQTMNWSSDPKYGDRPFSDLFNEKFAELIVIECAKVASDSVIDHSGHSETNICPKYLACHIKDHFGVEG